MRLEEVDYKAWAEKRVADNIPCHVEPMLCHPDFTFKKCVECLEKAHPDCEAKP